MGIGFLPNGVPFTPTKTDEDRVDVDVDVDFEQLWDEHMELSSAEVRDAYDQYGRSYRR